MDAASSTTAAMGKPTTWATPMIVAGNGEQTTAYASWVSSKIVSTATRQDIFEVSCAPSQCSGTELAKQTVTLAQELYVCPGSDYCPEEEDEDNVSTMTAIGMPIEYAGTAVVDGTTTEWALSMSWVKDNERSSGVEKDDMMTYVATTRVGDDTKATVSTAFPVNEKEGCVLFDNYAFVHITAGVDEMLKGYPEEVRSNEPLDADQFVPQFVAQRSVCAKKTSGADKAASETGKDGSGPKETGSSDGDDKEDDDNASGRTSLSFVLMGALLAVSVLMP